MLALIVDSVDIFLFEQMKRTITCSETCFLTLTTDENWKQNFWETNYVPATKSREQVDLSLSKYCLKMRLYEYIQNVQFETIS